ncbi:hypothetical protein TNCV_2159561 [Trichonephila clavipes]|nr:hypothetical protein TNCV_2159561 [Trichonephila clavipes]
MDTRQLKCYPCDFTPVEFTSNVSDSPRVDSKRAHILGDKPKKTPSQNKMDPSEPDNGGSVNDGSIRVDSSNPLGKSLGYLSHLFSTNPFEEEKVDIQIKSTINSQGFLASNEEKEREKARSRVILLLTITQIYKWDYILVITIEDLVQSPGAGITFQYGIIQEDINY